VNNCAKCTGPTNCLTCQQSYFWQISSSGLQGTCAQCASNCLTCSDNTAKGCTQCQANYFQNPTTSVNTHSLSLDLRNLWYLGLQYLRECHDMPNMRQ
jgi:hypothetical protein